MVAIKCKALTSHAKLPVRHYEDDACYDIYAAEFVELLPGETKHVHTALAMEIPEGYEGQLRPRSSVSKKGVIVHFGTVDAGFRGEVNVCVTNMMKVPFKVNIGDRIAQIAIRPVPDVKFEMTETLKESKRGENGYGSTGK